MKGLVIVICGYSGVGKNTVERIVMDRLKNIRFSVSCTTRAPRSGEEDGKAYYFITEEEFVRRIDNDEFIEHTRTFTNRYGTLKSEVDKYVSVGTDVLLDLNYVGADSVRRLYPDAISIFILPPSLEELEHRLRGRGSETADSLARRLHEVEIEEKEVCKFDYKVINDVAENCADQIVEIINAVHKERD